MDERICLVSRGVYGVTGPTPRGNSSLPKDRRGLFPSLGHGGCNAIMREKQCQSGSISRPPYKKRSLLGDSEREELDLLHLEKNRNLNLHRTGSSQPHLVSMASLAPVLGIRVTGPLWLFPEVGHISVLDSWVTPTLLWSRGILRSFWRCSGKGPMPPTPHTSRHCGLESPQQQAEGGSRLLQ